MKIQYKQRYGITLVSYLGLIGATSIRPGDKYDRKLGFAVAAVKAHARLNKRETALAEKLEKFPWKSLDIPQESVGVIVVTALQYRQALGQVKKMYAYVYPGQTVYDDVQDDNQPLVEVSKNGDGQPVCQVAEAFGRRLLKSQVL